MHIVWIEPVAPAEFVRVAGDHGVARLPNQTDTHSAINNSHVDKLYNTVQFVGYGSVNIGREDLVMMVVMQLGIG